MPIYEYRCADCGSKFEKLVRRAAESGDVNCPSCGRNHLTPELSTFAAHSGSATDRAPSMGGCAAGMCRTPDVCGRN